MSEDTQAIRAYFFKLGLSAEIADAYLALYIHGEQTISELARTSGVERTRLYRLMDVLRSTNLVEVESQYKRNILRAAPVSNLQILLSKKEEDLRVLHRDLGDLQALLVQSSDASNATRVQTYRGSEGIKQMMWNQTRGKTEHLSILYENLQSRTKLTFFERWVRIMNERKAVTRSIIGDNFVQTQKDWYKKNKNERIANWEGRYVPHSVFPITHSTVIYDDVTAYFNWKDGEIFGVEIHNQQIADAQRQFFEMLWGQGQTLDI